MTWVYSLLLVLGFVLDGWALVSLPPRTNLGPVPIVTVSHRGPYRWLKHPMYLGHVLFVMGAAGLAAGIWNAIAVGTVCELLVREWAWREKL